MKGIYQYKDLKTDEIVYVGKDSHIDKYKRHKDHLRPSNYNQQQINRVLQNNPDRYEYGVIWATEDCTTLKLNKMEILFGKIYNPRFNFDKFGKGGPTKISEEHKQKISEANKGKILSDEHKKKISKNNARYWKNKHLSDEHKEKISESKKDKTYSDEIKENMSKGKNTSGYLYVSKQKNSSYKQGFCWKYTYRENGKTKAITSVNFEELEKKVKAKGLKWKKLEEKIT